MGFCIFLKLIISYRNEEPENPSRQDSAKSIEKNREHKKNRNNVAEKVNMLSIESIVMQ